MVNYSEVLTFWFEELTPKDWFIKNEDLDQKISHRFGKTLFRASKGELFSWRDTPEGRLAEILVLDQFSRNIFRGNKKSFSNDEIALVLAQEMVHQKLDESLSVTQRAFVYMPYMHSESLLIHEVAMNLFSLPGLEDNLDFEIKHKEIIEKFGRYPHRNAVLGRESTTDEKKFLESHSGF